MRAQEHLDGAAPFTAVVVTWNSAAELPGLIESVEHHLGDRCRLLFVDNASLDDTVAMIERTSPRHRLIRLDRNFGFGAANNVGVRAADTAVVALMNPDTVLVDGSLAELAQLAADERALFSPRLLNTDGSAQISAHPALGSWESALVSFWPGALMPPWLRKRCEPWRFDLRLPAGWLSGACLVANRELLLELGPFDERLALYGEDADLSLRGWLAGVASISAPDVARVVHLGNRSAAQAFDDLGTQRKIEARWWVAQERLGAVRGVSDLAAEFVLHTTRYVVKRLVKGDALSEAHWIGAAVRVARTGRPQLKPLPAQALLGNGAHSHSDADPRPSTSTDWPELNAVASQSWSRRLTQLDRPRAVSNSWFATRYLLGSHRVTYPLLRLTPSPYSRVRVEARTDACIDGLPKSANTFAGWVFMDQNPGARLAHHMHVPLQTEEAVRLGVPSAALIRSPVQNVTAIVTSRERELSLTLALKVYIHFLSRLLTLADSIVVCTFDQVIEDPSVVAWALNRRFGTSFSADPVSCRYKQRLRSLITGHERDLGARAHTANGSAEVRMRARRAAAAELVAQHPLRPTAEALYANLAGLTTARRQ